MTTQQINTWYTTLLFLGAVYSLLVVDPRGLWYSTLFFLGAVYPTNFIRQTRKWYSTLFFSGCCIPSTGIQLPKVLVATSHVTTNQQSIPASTTTMHLHRR